jgi:hypothetical protein
MLPVDETSNGMTREMMIGTARRNNMVLSLTADFKSFRNMV